MGENPRPVVVVTGAAGRVASMLGPGLENDYDLRLVDLPGSDTPPGPVQRGFVGDLADPGFAAEVMAGADALVHLAGNPSPRATWPQARSANLDLTVSVLESARLSGVSNVVYASSMHAAGYYEKNGDRPVDPSWPARPCCLYGVSKASAEAVSRWYCDTYGMKVICLRLGWVRPRPQVRLALTSWLSPGDLGRLVASALAADRHYGIYFGASANTRGHWDISNARTELGYQPHDDAEKYADQVPPDSLNTFNCQ